MNKLVCCDYTTDQFCISLIGSTMLLYVVHIHRKKECFNKNAKLHLICLWNPYYVVFCVFQTHFAVSQAKNAQMRF